MAQINMSSVMGKVKQYSKSEDGKKKVQNTLKQYRKSDKHKTESGFEILTEQKMKDLAQELIDLLKTTVDSYTLPDSIKPLFNQLTYRLEDLGNDKFQCCIYFSDEEDLKRESLETDYNQGEGINNIVALFNNGYSAKKPKYGWWNGHKPEGNAIQYATPGVYNDAYIVSKQQRDGLHFMQNVIEDFYSQYCNRYNIKLTLSNEYK